jgi:predicted MFS family arabinose efflux permease
VTGISAAAGKIGAAIGGILIQPLFEEYGLATTLIVCGTILTIATVTTCADALTSGCVSFSGFIVTWFLVEETKGKPLKEEEAE